MSFVSVEAGSRETKRKSPTKELKVIGIYLRALISQILVEKKQNSLTQQERVTDVFQTVFLAASLSFNRKQIEQLQSDWKTYKPILKDAVQRIDLGEKTVSPETWKSLFGQVDQLLDPELFN